MSDFGKLVWVICCGNVDNKLQIGITYVYFIRKEQWLWTKWTLICKLYMEIGTKSSMNTSQGDFSDPVLFCTFLKTTSKNFHRISLLTLHDHLSCSEFDI